MLSCDIDELSPCRKSVAVSSCARNTYVEGHEIFLDEVAGHNAVTVANVLGPSNHKGMGRDGGIGDVRAYRRTERPRLGNGEMMRVLIAEDHDRLAWAMAGGLRRHGLIVDVATHGDDALTRLRSARYDVVVLDRDLPGTHGDDICRILVAERCECRILMLTAASSVSDRVEGLGLGADDYLPKPFDFAELLARIQTLARRPGIAKTETLRFRDLIVDPQRHLATREGRDLSLSPKEFAVLEYLLAAEGRPVGSEELLEHAWGLSTDSETTTVKSTINRLRTKIGEPALIETVRELGYRIGGGR